MLVVRRDDVFYRAQRINRRLQLIVQGHRAVHPYRAVFEAHHPHLASDVDRRDPDERALRCPNLYRSNFRSQPNVLRYRDCRTQTTPFYEVSLID